MHLDITLEHYEAALKSLKETEKTIEAEQVLAVLNARDAVQIALKKQSFIPNSRLKKVIELDVLLREKALLITKTINNKTDKQFADWRKSVQPSADAWWWRLETSVPLHPWDQLDWLWKLLSFAGWTANVSLLVNIATRFFSAGGVGLLGAVAVTLPSVLTLLQANSEITKTGQEGFDKLLDAIKVPKHFREEAKFASIMMMSLFLVIFWLNLSSISIFYNRHNIEAVKEHYEGKLGSAEQNYLKAIALNPDNFHAYYNLGTLYEEFQNLDRAKKQYLIAVAGGVPQAYNNLGRLYIHEKKYPQAAALLLRGLVLAEKNSNPETKYSLLKNLGWARLQQGRYEEAEQALQAAIGIARNPDAKKYIPNPGAAHCLLAQALEKLKRPTALEQWRQCSQLGSRLNPDEDTWLHLAKEKLSKSKVREAGK